MRNVKFLLIVVMLLALAVPLVASAQAVTYTSGFQIQNLSSTQANIVMTYYDQAGNPTSVNDTIPANGSKTYYPLTAVPAGFTGSMVVSSDQQIAAIVNVLGNNGQRADSYSSFSQGATTMNLPLVEKNNFNINTWFSVQNTGSTAASVSVAYKPGACTESATIPAFASKTFDQSTNGCLPSGFVGAATVTSAQPLAITVMQVTPQSLLAYTGFGSTSTNPIMPLVSSGYFKSGTGIQIQNTGATNTNVTISYTPSAGFPGSACTETRTVPASTSVTFAYPTFPAGCGASFVGSGKVTGNSANMPLVAIVNQVTQGSAGASSYDAINSANATSKVSLPLIMDRNFKYFTGFSIANVGTQSTNVSCTFSGTAYNIPSTAVAPGASLTAVQLNVIAAGYVGSAVCTASGGDQKIAGIVNQSLQGAPATTDALFTYGAFNY